jgi:hypothetical protein
MKSLMSFVLLSVILSSCATAPEPNQAVELAIYEAMGKCFDAEKGTEAEALDKLSDPKDVLLHEAIAGLTKAANKGISPCINITTNNDLQKVAMEENTKQIQAGVDFAKSAAGNIVVGVGVWKGLDVLPELFAGAGSSVVLDAGGDIALTDSLNTASVGDIFGAGDIGGMLSNPDNSIKLDIPAAPID